MSDKPLKSVFLHGEILNEAHAVIQHILDELDKILKMTVVSKRFTANGISLVMIRINGRSFAISSDDYSNYEDINYDFAIHVYDRPNNISDANVKVIDSVGFKFSDRDCIEMAINVIKNWSLT